MEIRTSTTVGQIVRYNFKAAQLFDAYHIDFCCGGDISLSEACSESGEDIDKLMTELDEVLKGRDSETIFIEGLDLDQLSDYIVSRHHAYVNDHIPFLQQKLQKLCDVHGTNHPELFRIKEIFEIVAGNLTTHMKKEELILFPLLHKIAAIRKKSPTESGSAGEVQKTIRELEDEHQAEGDRFKEIAKISGNYTVPPDGCATFQVTYGTLQEFEDDLHRHIHLESNVLFKKAVAPGE